MKKKALFVMLLAATLSLCTACGKKEKTSDQKAEATTEATTEAAQDSATTEQTAETKSGMTGVVQVPKIKGFDQLAKPQKGETVATIKVKDYGDITVRLFDEIAPYGVKNFVTHAKKGYYDGVTFHRVINDFMIQGGDPEGTGMGGESIWGDSFYNEISKQACVIRGSLCYANTGSDPSNGSQFFITQAKKVTQKNLEQLESQGLKLTDAQKKSYLKNGGAPWLQGGYTVFGQVVEGMDVVDKIAAVEVDANDAPTSKVVIDTIKVSTQK